ncbi:TOMM system kinase/cyclase fusion protein [Polyangium sp. 6x1]|uniref:TOMM system kinase/cyclase fusion protein n=1 Tax=Polyangium sp. 6x1 TaxID=3042689 RepID=UPI002482C1EB|nr:TOMM system kinase/cyclase fusion protein [Polyangium sp. 6x1]MDI1443052.1 TOMM system kinase/cyclase fusion protein [Polyangium sp. 6x1]
MSSILQRYDEAFVPGATFADRYEILAKLGEGGFGVVHKARQLTTGQPIALKILRPTENGSAPQGGTRVARFLRETELCAQLHHPNIVKLVDAGQTGDGILYTAFAFAPGDTLAALLEREGALAPREAGHLMLQVLDALACAHTAGVVHRDLKPSNIMVIPTGARRNALVLDFGIGSTIDADLSSRLTGSHDALGTPGYGAPEQWRGADPSPRADLFSWGLVFLECLTGKPVYGGTAAEIFYRLLDPDPVPIPAAIERHPLGDLLTRAVRKDVAARDVTARGLLDALDACDLRGLSREGMLVAGGASAGARPGPLASSAMLTASLDERPGAAPPALDGERRQLTALCCRLKARAAAEQDFDVDALDGPLRSALALCADVGRLHGGYVAATLGDKLLIYFGYPSAAEDDAKRAARAALAMVGAVDDMAAQQLAVQGVRVEVSIGVHTGPVVDGDLGGLHRANLVTGATPRLAARLAALSPPGSVTVSAASQALLRVSFALETDEVRSIEGIAAQVETFRLGQERASATRWLTPDGSKAPLAGRDRELDLLLERWRRACDGEGQSCLITGEPGIGKSRLARELRERLSSEDPIFLEGRCASSTQHNALSPVVELVERALGLDQDRDANRKIARLEGELSAHGFALAETMPLFLPLLSLPLGAPYAPLDVSPQRQKALTLQAITSLLFAMTDKRPVFLLVEDLHWADATTMELLTELVREAPTVPMCILMTARPELSSSFPTTDVLLLPLSRLERPQIEQMLTALAGRKALPAPVIEQVAERADGVPLFVEELLRMMVDSGLLSEQNDRYELTGPIAGAAIPGTLRALLTARLDRLSRAKETAQFAAALGREFSVEVLSAASPHGPAVVADDLERLMSAGLVLRKRRGKDAVAAFKHALVRDAAYESLSTSARQRVHARIAGTMEERFPEVVRTRPDLLAHHHAAAEQKRLAVPYAQRAAERGLHRSTYAESIAHATNAVAWASALPDAARVEAELAANGVLTQALMATRGWADPQVKATTDRSASLVQRLERDSAHRVPMLWFLFTYHHVASNRRTARGVAEELVAIAERSGDRGLCAAAAALHGLALFMDGDHADARRAVERAVELYDPELHRDHGARFGLDSLVLAKAYVAQLCWFSGDDAAAFALVASTLEWAREVSHVPSIAIGLLYGGMVHQLAGDRGTVASMTGELLALSGKYGLPAYEGYAAALHDWATGDGMRARAIVQVLSDLGCKLGLSYYGSLVADAQAERGELDGALACIDHCLVLCRENDEHFYEPVLHLRRALYEARKDPASEGVRLSLEEAARLGRQKDMPRIEALATLELSQRFGRTEERRARLDELRGRHPGLQGIEIDDGKGGVRWA